MPALWEQDGGQDHDRCHHEDQRDQDVGGEPKSAAVVPDPHLLAVVVVAAEGRVGLLPGVGKTWSELVSQRSGIPLALTVGRELGKGDVGLGWEDGRHG